MLPTFTNYFDKEKSSCSPIAQQNLETSVFRDLAICFPCLIGIHFELADGELQAVHLFTYDLYAFGLQFSNAVSLVVDWGHRLTSTSCFVRRGWLAKQNEDARKRKKSVGFVILPERVNLSCCSLLFGFQVILSTSFAIETPRGWRWLATGELMIPRGLSHRGVPEDNYFKRKIWSYNN